MLDPFDPFLESNRPRAPKRWRTLEDYLRPGMPLLLVYPDAELTLSPEARADLTGYARRRPARAVSASISAARTLAAGFSTSFG